MISLLFIESKASPHWNALFLFPTTIRKYTKPNVVKNHQVRLVSTVPRYVSTHWVNRISEDITIESIVDKTSTRTSKRPSKTWQRRFEELRQFQEEHGHCNIPRNEKALRNWIQKQRAAYKLYLQRIESDDDRLVGNRTNGPSPLTVEQVDTLNSIGFIWNVHDWRFQQNLQELQEFYENNGHINIDNMLSSTTSDGDLKLLSKWLYRQKEEYKKYLNGIESTLTNEKRESLEKLGFHIGMFEEEHSSVKKYRVFNRTSWEGQYQDLVEFKTQHNHCIVPRNVEAYTKLSGWVQHQRAEKKKKDNGLKSRLTDEKERRLTEIGFIWSLQDKVWNQRLNELREFKSIHGHVRVPTKRGKLGNWVMIQRLQYGLRKRHKKNTLSEERVQALDDLGFEWDIHEVTWEEKFNELSSRMQNSSSLDIKHDQSLYSWIAVQRVEKRYKQKGLQSHLTDEREAKLDEIGFDWNADADRKKQRQAHWNKNFQMLKDFKKKYGTCRVPVRKGYSKEEKSFSHWVRDQRRYYKLFVTGHDAPMTEERRSLLESIGFDDEIQMP